MASAAVTSFIVFIPFLFLMLNSSAAHYIPCSESLVEIAQGKHISHCKKLTTLGVEFGWEVSKHDERQIDILVSKRLNNAEMMWLAWGVNPQVRPQMVGTRAIIGIRQLNGSAGAKTYNITADTKLGCRLQPSEIDVQVKNMSLDYVASFDYLTLHATIVLPSIYNISRLNHVWQVGYGAQGAEPAMHPTALQNFDSTETIDLKNGSAQHVGGFERRLRKVHGVLNIIGWGTFLPAGVIIARYFPYPLELGAYRYHLHVACQIIGYNLGVVGWSIGLWLGQASKEYKFKVHRIFSIFIFTFTTLQVLALRWKPHKTDDYRKYWNMYHHFLGYALLAVISLNIFHGIDILKPDHSWKRAYVGILGVFGVIVTALEIFTWAKYLTEDKKPKPDVGPGPGPGNPKPGSGRAVAAAAAETQPPT
ncbi:hypothetical protein OIU77_003465 [Salix suchowensis]|uniref:Cytochrome b561 and DOMON domain-containing protein n=1 Tax=Salix suchowensis TaxID=1278906 RepID=A0ABQ9B126_9ROSI|nr:hypothetical protein OIU77_003465 [Salix suchowensis]